MRILVILVGALIHHENIDDTSSALINHQNIDDTSRYFNPSWEY